MLVRSTKYKGRTDDGDVCKVESKIKVHCPVPGETQVQHGAGQG